MSSPSSRKRKAGLPAGTLMYTGSRQESPIRITTMHYGPDFMMETEGFNAECPPSEAGVCWIDVDGIHDADLIRSLGTRFGIHPLTMEDLMNPHQRPKVERYEGYQFLVVKMLHGSDGTFLSEQISMIFTPTVLLTFQDGKKGDVFDGVRERIRSGDPHIREAGPDYLGYCLLDAVVDQYFVVLARFGDRLEFLEEEILSRPRPDGLLRVHALKMELLELRRAVWPLRELLSSLIREPSLLIKPDTVIFLRDVHDHAVQVMDTVEIDREIVAGVIDTFMSASSNRLNEVMKVLTIISTIFIPLTFIVGVYGMNFDFMPELHHPLGYPLVWMVMIALGLGMIMYFKKKRWW